MESTAPVMTRQKWPLTLPLLVAVAMGAGYGLALRYVFGKIGSRWGIDWIMSIAFLVFGSRAIGFLPASAG
jgi:L-cystine uptake protein TcyP (sodium:dicarboxylate symporter family)